LSIAFNLKELNAVMF